MARPLWLGILLVLLIGVYVPLSKKIWSERLVQRTTLQAGYVLPSALAGILALDYKGLAADLAIARVINFTGGRSLSKTPMTGADWDYIQAALTVAVDLDPYAQDSYLLIESLLPWEGERVEAANRLLEKGAGCRTNDWELLFFLGFNHYYFLKDYEKAADYLMAASKIPDSPSFLPPFAARLAHTVGKSQTAALFLKGIVQQTADPRVRANLEKRLLALESASAIEDMVARFQQEQGRLPTMVGELLSFGYAKKIPEDPYGGEWTISATGAVESSSKFSGN